jgi:4-hydroxy-tetrahydrodipicolinate synthase
MIKGLWAAIPTPWDERMQFDEKVLGHNIERYQAFGVDGVYTTDSDGEFYAIELEEFRRLAAAFGRYMRDTSMDAAMGVTWSHTQGIIDRIRAALDNGIQMVHVAFPYWNPLAHDEVDFFFDDLAQAVPEARWIHYNNPNSKRTLRGADYARLSAAFPEQLVGSKQGGHDMMQMEEIICASPELDHFGVEYNLVLLYMLGGKGVYSYWANTLPGWEREWIDACQQGQWEQAWQMQFKLWEWERKHVSPIRRAGHLSGVVGKARAALTGILEDNRLTRAPYRPVSDRLWTDLKQNFDRFWAEEIQAESGFADLKQLK